MGTVGAGDAMYGMRRRILEIRSEIEKLGEFEHSPELIDSANLLRSNEYLAKKAQIQSELADSYAEYVEALESMLSDVFEIQKGLGEVLREQSSMLSGSGTGAKKQTKRPKAAKAAKSRARS